MWLMKRIKKRDRERKSLPGSAKIMQLKILKKLRNNENDGKTQERLFLRVRVASLRAIRIGLAK